MKNFCRIVGMMIGAFFLGLVFLFLAAPIANDRIAYRAAQTVQEIALPPDTMYLETFSAAGKLVGNGNGMQYLGGILIQSERSLQELQAHYSQAAANGLICFVEKQVGNTLSFVEHEKVLLRTHMDGASYYVVYAWADSDSVFALLDLRGH